LTGDHRNPCPRSISFSSIYPSLRSFPKVSFNDFPDYIPDFPCSADNDSSPNDIHAFSSSCTAHPPQSACLEIKLLIKGRTTSALLDSGASSSFIDRDFAELLNIAFEELGLLGVDSNGDWVGRHLRCMRKPLVAKSGHGDGWSVELDGGGGSARRGLAGASRPGFSRGYSIPNRAQKVREKVLKLTRGSWWPELLCKVDAGVVVRRWWGGTHGPGGAGLLRAPGTHGSTSGGAAKRTRGSGWLELRRRRAIATAGELT